ncbi:MAG TPA: hypothetical protein VN328_06315, partial [Thermodesulfovibrionales bacterium]|nr:hypothetical protein [Thermodesulfovibrionales bacterium]
MGKKKKKEKAGSKFGVEEKTRGKSGPSSNIKIWSTALFVAAVTLVVYLPALSNQFVNWDDDLYVYENPHIRSLDAGFIKWMFQFNVYNWHPLTLLSHAIDYRIWKLNPMGHHLTNIVLHSMNTFLLGLLTVHLVLCRKGEALVKTDGGLLRKALITGGITALLFGIHPVHVESVAWVSERKDVLSAFFVLLTLMCYVKYVAAQGTDKRSSYYIGSLIFFILALMSKPMAVTLPAILMILDVYPFQRFHLKGNILSQKMVLIEKVPFVFFSLASSVLTVIAQHEGGAVKPVGQYLFSNRLVMAVKGLYFYLEKMVLPVGLSPFYPYPTRDISFLNPAYFIPLLLVVMISMMCVWAWKRGKKIFAAAWVYYVVTLLPILGIIQVGGQAAADR